MYIYYLSICKIYAFVLLPKKKLILIKTKHYKEKNKFFNYLMLATGVCLLRSQR